MSLKQEIQIWVEALRLYDDNCLDESIEEFIKISDTAKILFNCGVIYATLGLHEEAVGWYQQAIQRDQYLAIAYFQQGVSNFLMREWDKALVNFNDALLYLRGNKYIDYDQLGLKYKLHSCEVIFNRGLCYLNLNNEQQGMQDLFHASQEKQDPLHDVIDEAIHDNAFEYTVFSIPVKVLYRPHESKVKNLHSKDYLGKARTVATTDRNNTSVGFAGAELKRMNSIATTKDDRPEDSISYAATNLVKPDIKAGTTSSQIRQQSEPPKSRELFPPTPPPENPPSNNNKNTDYNGPLTGNSESRISKPRPLDLSQLSNGSTSEARPSMRPRAASAAVTVSGESPSRPARLRTRPALPVSASSVSTERGSSTTRNGPEREIPPSEYIRQRSYNSALSPTGTYNSALSPGGPYNSALSPGGRTDTSTDSYGRQQQNLAYRPARKVSRPNLRGRQSASISEAEEDEGDDFISSYGDTEPEFDMLSARSVRSARSSTVKNQQQQQQQQQRMLAAPLPPPADITKICVKVHSDEIRCIMVPVDIAYEVLMNKIRAKFKLQNKFTLKFKDEGDLIDFDDQDDLELLIEQCKSQAKKDRSELGKMDVWITSLP